MKRLLFSACLLSAFSLIADGQNAATVQPTSANPAPAVKMVRGPDGKMYKASGKRIDRAKLEASMYKRFGGNVKRPGVQKGKLFYLDCQSALDRSVIVSNANFFAKEEKIEIVTEGGSFDLAKPQVRGEATLFIVDDPKLPMSLFAPEARWGMVNVAPLKCDKPQFFAARARKALSRGFSFLAGAVASQYPHPLMKGMTGPENLDACVYDVPPVDVMKRFPTYLEGYGITPYRMATYRKACEEGWAANPTNDVQKAIWDEVHSIPDKPIKIQFDPATQKGKVTK